MERLLGSKLKVFLILLIFPLLLQAENIAFLTIPKSGTNLLAKAIYLITGKGNLMRAYTQIGENTVYFGHTWPDQCPFSNSLKWKKVILIRDPRDSLLSLMYWEERSASERAHTLKLGDLREFQALSQEEKLNYLLLIPRTIPGLPCFVDIAMKWVNDPDTLLIRFEDLVGEQGGGDQTRQENVIRWLGEFLGYHLTNQEVTRISSSLFGTELSATFRKGQIGGWKEEFSEENKELFKRILGKELIALGYEINDRW